MPGGPRNPLSAFGRMYDPINQRQEGNVRTVTSAESFRRARNLIAAAGQPATILLARSFHIKAPLLIPASCGGLLTVTALNGVRVHPTGVVDSVFQVEGSCLLDKITAGTATDPATDYFKAFVTSPGAVVSMVRCLACADRFLTGADVEGNSSLDYGLCDVMEQCSLIRPTGASGSLGPIHGYVTRCISNYLDTTGGDAVFLEGGCVIVGNTLQGGGDINTGSGTGYNVLAANVQSGGGSFNTPTLHSTDLDLDHFTFGLKSATTTVSVSAATAPSAGQALVASSSTAASWAAPTPAAHASSHQNGGSDEISVAGLSGKLADGQDALALLSATTTVNVNAATAPSAGQVLTATSSTAATWQAPSASPWTTVTKATTETIQSDATLGADADIKFAMSANTTYVYRLVVFFETTANADFQYDFTGPAGPTRVSSRRLQAAAGGLPTERNIDIDYAGTAEAMTSAFAVNTGIVKADGIIENGGTAGDFAIRWAQNTSDASNTSVLKGSYLEWMAL